MEPINFLLVVPSNCEGVLHMRFLSDGERQKTIHITSSYSAKNRSINFALLVLRSFNKVFGGSRALRIALPMLGIPENGTHRECLLPRHDLRLSRMGQCGRSVLILFDGDQVEIPT